MLLRRRCMELLCIGLLEIGSQASVLLVGVTLHMLRLYAVQRRQQRQLLWLWLLWQADMLNRRRIELLLLQWRRLLDLHLHGLLRTELRLSLSCPVWLQVVLGRLQARLQLSFLLDQLCLLLLGFLLCLLCLLLRLLRLLRFRSEQLPRRQRSRRRCRRDRQAGERCHVLRLRRSLLAGALRRRAQVHQRHAANFVRTLLGVVEKAAQRQSWTTHICRQLSWPMLLLLSSMFSTPGTTRRWQMQRIRGPHAKALRRGL